MIVLVQYRDHSNEEFDIVDITYDEFVAGVEEGKLFFTRGTWLWFREANRVTGLPVTDVARIEVQTE